jgi:hypothetical protein
VIFLLYEQIKKALWPSLIDELLVNHILTDYGSIELIDHEMAVRTAYDLADDYQLTQQWMTKFDIEELEDEPSDGRLMVVFRLGADYGFWRMQTTNQKEFEEEYEVMLFQAIYRYPIEQQPWSTNELMFDELIQYHMMKSNYNLRKSYLVILRIIHELGQIVGVQHHFQLKYATS